MDKQKLQNLVKRYVSLLALCVLVLLIGISFSVPIKVEVHSAGGKPPLMFALLFSALSLAAAILAAFSTYLSWFQGAKARSNVKRTIETMAERFPVFRLPIYNPTFVFWYLRIITPITTILFFGLFLLVLFSAF